MESSRGQETSAFLAAELQFEWQRKTSLEGRALAIITADTALIALLISVATQLHPDRAQTVVRGALTLSGLVCMAASVLAALLVNVPLDYSSPPPEALNALVEDVLNLQSPDELLLESTLRTRVAEIKAARQRNALKITFSFGALFLTASATLLLIFATIYG